MDRIKFGPEGWNGIIAKDFTVQNVVKITNAVGLWLNKQFPKSRVVLGYDCRFGGEMFSAACAKVLASKGIQVYLQEKIVAAPALSVAVKELDAQCGIMIGAGNESYQYNGIKLKGSFGGAMLEKDIIDIENLITDDYTIDLELLNWDTYLEQGIIQYINLDAIYFKHVSKEFQLQDILSKINIGIDVMYGSTKNILSNLCPSCEFIRAEYIPTFKGIAPEPSHKNLNELADLVTKNKLGIGIAFNGDGTRIAVVDEEGTGYNSQQILMLITYYLARYNGLEGIIALSAPVTEKAELMAANTITQVKRTKAGFRHITELMIKEPVLVGADESGGIGLGNNIPDKDGIWTMFTILSIMAETKKSLKELMLEAQEITGTFVYSRFLFFLTRSQMNRFLDFLKNTQPLSLGQLPIADIQTGDGYRLQIQKYKWIMFYPSQLSGHTRVYAEAETVEELDEMIHTFMQTMKEVTEKE